MFLLSAPNYKVKAGIGRNPSGLQNVTAILDCSAAAPEKLHWDGTGSRKQPKRRGGNGTRAGSREVTRTMYRRRVEQVDCRHLDLESTPVRGLSAKGGGRTE